MRRAFVSGILATLLLLICAAAQAQTPTVLYSFNANNSGDPIGFQNSGILAQGQDGNIYTTSVSGGQGTYPYPEGTLFQVTSTGSSVTELLTFTLSNEQGCPDGCNPYSGVEPLPDGNFLVAPLTGGQSGYGPVLIVSPDGSSVTPLYGFTGGSDGGQPYSAPILGTDGNYYGTTTCGGSTPCGNMSQGCGTVYQLTDAGTLGWVYQFSDGADGCNGFAPLVEGNDGNFYGSAGGGTGSIFRITPTGVFTVLNTTEASAAPLVKGSDGNFYGTSVLGAGNCGDIFKMTPAGKLTVLHSLNPNESEGCDLYAGLAQGTDGYFYGVTAAGGLNNWGTIFRVGAKGGSTFSVLYHFDGAIGGVVKVPLLQHTNGLFYGLGNVGGIYGYGSLFSLDEGLKPFARLVTTSGPVGASIGILGQGFTGTKKVTFTGGSAAFNVISDTYLTATVPTGARSGYVSVKTPTGKLKSNSKFNVTH